VETLERGGLAGCRILERGRNARTGAAEALALLLEGERPPGSTPALERTLPAIVEHRRLLQAVQREYARVALFPGKVHGFDVGPNRAIRLGYPEDLLARLPAAVRQSMCPAAFALPAAGIRAGEVVVDVGCGSGADALLASEAAGPEGEVVGVDPTPELLRKAAPAASAAGYRNVRFERGTAEDLPLPDAAADVVLANGVVNLLVADKERALAEAFRVLRPGGRLVMADVVVPSAASRADRAVPARWAQGLAGALPEGEVVEMVGAPGFEAVAVEARGDGLALFTARKPVERRV